jgi:hypothetical protein
MGRKSMLKSGFLLVVGQALLACCVGGATRLNPPAELVWRVV